MGLSEIIGCHANARPGPNSAMLQNHKKTCEPQTSCFLNVRYLFGSPPVLQRDQESQAPSTSSDLPVEKPWQAGDCLGWVWHPAARNATSITCESLCAYPMFCTYVKHPLAPDHSEIFTGARKGPILSSRCSYTVPHDSHDHVLLRHLKST